MEGGNALALNAWTSFTLADLGVLRNGVNFNQGQEGLGLPVIKVKDFQDRVLVPKEGLDELNPNAMSISELMLIQPGDTLIIRSNGNGDMVGRCLYVDATQRPTTFSGFCIRFRPNPDVIHPRFASYLLRSSICRDPWVAYGSGTGIQNINQDIIGRTKVEIPDLGIQATIAGLLGVIDDKLELNRKMNRTLEEMAQGLFRSWFIDFDPVVANSEDRRPIGVPKAIAPMFPDHFEDSELGPIPQGWKVARVGSEFRIVMGQSPPGKTYNDQGIGLPFYQGRTDFTFRYPSRRIYCSAATRFAEPGDTLVSVRAPVGDINLASESCSIGRGVAAVRHISGAGSYTYYCMNGLREAFDVYNGEGTLFGAINRPGFDGILFVCPPPSLIQAFEKVAFRLDQLIESNEKESRVLKNLRDTMIDPLLSGELSLSEAKGLIEKAMQ